jgi:hypothetical protein
MRALASSLVPFAASAGLASVAIVALVASPRDARADVMVAGIVDSPLGDPIAGATIVVEGPDGQPIARAVTDAKGAYRLVLPTPLATGSGVGARLRLRATAAGLVPFEAPLSPGTTFVHATLAALPEAPADTEPAAEIEVRGERRAPSSEVSARPTRYELESSLLMHLPGTRGDPFAAVTSLPSMARPPSLSTVYVVRGAAPDESVTYVDGAPMPHAFHFGGVVSVIPPGLVQSISLAPGGFGVAYGRATAGLVEVKLAQIPEGLHASLGFDAIDVGVLGSASLGEGTRVAIGARRSHVDAWIGSFVGDRVSGELPRYLDGQLVLEHDFGARARVRATLFAADDAVKVTDPTIPEGQPRTGSWTSRYVRAHARLDAKLADDVSLLLVTAYTRSKDAIIGDTDEWGDARSSFFARLETEATLAGRVRASVGMDLQAEHVDGTRILSIPASAFGGSAVFPMRGVVHVERVQPAAYAQLILPIADGVQITTGVRVDRAPLGEILVQPRVALRAEAPSGRTVLKATAGLYARPNALDAVSARDFLGAYLPVPVLSGPARGLQASGGIEQALAKDVRLDVSLWTRTGHHVLVPREQPAVPIYGNKLTPNPAENITGYQYPLYSETGRLRAVGVEAMLGFGTPAAPGSTESGWMGFLGYALSRSEIQDDPYAAWRRMPLDQTHVLNAAAIVRLGGGWEVGARFRLAIGVQDSPYPASQIAPKSDPNLDPSRPLPNLAPIHSLDVRIEKTFRIGKSGDASVYLEARNAYDRRAREPLAYNPVYQYAVVGEGLPIIPNLGVRGSF